MTTSSAFEELEILLIELEYAAADFADSKTSMAATPELGVLEAMLSKLVNTNREVQIAIGVVQRRHPDGAQVRGV
jgi:hypothetical protein